jgi:hypothetical protein
MLTVRLNVDASTQVRVSTACTSMPLTLAAIPPAVDRSRLGVSNVCSCKEGLEEGARRW